MDCYYGRPVFLDQTQKVSSPWIFFSQSRHYHHLKSHASVIVMKQTCLFDAIKWNDQGLVATIAQDAESNEILMLAWMNRQALEKTLETQQAVYWSRSRQQLWHKGELSGNVQDIREILLDCDGDTLLIKVKQAGGIACHTGRANCFFRALRGQRWEETMQVLKSPEEIYQQQAAQDE